MSGAAITYDPADLAHIADPYPEYARLRAQPSPAVATGAAGTEDMWVLSRYADVSAALRDPETFSSIVDPESPPVLLNLDGEEHARLRALAARIFGARQVSLLRGWITAIAAERVSSLLRTPGPHEVVGELAMAIPSRVVCAMLGVPSDRDDDLRRFATALDNQISVAGFGIDESHFPDLDTDLGDFAEWLSDLVEARRDLKEQPDDLLGISCRCW
jgi:cytochrome P450